MIGRLAKLGVGVGRQVVPGFVIAERIASRVGEALLQELKHHLDALEPPRQQLALPAPFAPKLEDLLAQSVEDTPTTSRRSLDEQILRNLIPDEARILSRVADGTPFPLIHVVERRSRRRLLENVSNVGTAAGVSVPARTRVYVTRMLSLGLLEVGPVDDALRDKYELLAADVNVRRAMEAASGRLPARIDRHTVRIAPLGKELWNASREVRDDRDPGGA
jgi:hypothetical protein